MKRKLLLFFACFVPLISTEVNASELKVLEKPEGICFVQEMVAIKKDQMRTLYPQHILCAKDLGQIASYHLVKQVFGYIKNNDGSCLDLELKSYNFDKRYGTSFCPENGTSFFSDTEKIHITNRLRMRSVDDKPMVIYKLD